MFSNIVLSGGATKGLAFIGVIKYLEENNLMDALKTFVGASSGSLICYLAAIGYTNIEIEVMCKQLIHEYNLQPVNIVALLNINHELGVDNGNVVCEWLYKCTFKKFGTNKLTFLEFTKKTGKHFVVCASNLTKKQPFYFSVDNTPNVFVSDAIRASISIPLIFTPVLINNQLFVDAGVFNNFPIDFIHDFTLKNTIGVSIQNKEYNPTYPLNIFSYFHLILDTIIDRINLKSDINHNIIHVIIDDSQSSVIDFNFNSMKINIDASKVKQLIQNGYESIKNTLHTGNM